MRVARSHYVPVLAGIAAALLLALTACQPSASQGGAEWRVHGGNDLEQRFSTLIEINRDNVAQLGLAWSHEVDTNRAW